MGRPAHSSLLESFTWSKVHLNSGAGYAVLPLMMIMLFTVLFRNKLRIPLEGTYS